MKINCLSIGVTKSQKPTVIEVSGYNILKNKKFIGSIAIDGNIYKNGKEITPYKLFDLKENENIAFSIMNLYTKKTVKVRFENLNIIINNDISMIKIIEKGFYIKNKKLTFESFIKHLF